MNDTPSTRTFILPQDLPDETVAVGQEGMFFDTDTRVVRFCRIIEWLPDNRVRIQSGCNHIFELPDNLLVMGFDDPSLNFVIGQIAQRSGVTIALIKE